MGDCQDEWRAAMKECLGNEYILGLSSDKNNYEMTNMAERTAFKHSDKQSCSLFVVC